jgi:hypothetical protein
MREVEDKLLRPHQSIVLMIMVDFYLSAGNLQLRIEAGRI